MDQHLESYISGQRKTTADAHTSEHCFRHALASGENNPLSACMWIASSHESIPHPRLDSIQRGGASDYESTTFTTWPFQSNLTCIRNSSCRSFRKCIVLLQYQYYGLYKPVWMCMLYLVELLLREDVESEDSSDELMPTRGGKGVHVCMLLSSL